MASNVPQHIKDLIKQEEGFRDEVYSDASGYSAGYGHFLSDEELKKYPPGSKVPKDQAEAWFEEDVAKSYEAARVQNQQLPQPVDEGRLTSVNYQLGEAWNDIAVNPKAFDKTWGLMQAGDFAGASTEVLDSEWAKTQTPVRAQKFSTALASMGQTTPTPLTSTPTTPSPGPTTQTSTSPVMSMFSSSMGPQPAGSPSPRAYSGPGGPGTLVGQVGQGQAVAVAGFTSPYADQNIRITPADVGSRFKEAVHAGSLQLESDIERFGAIYNLLTGDEETAQAQVRRADLISEVSGEMLSGLGTFEEFLDARRKNA